MSKLFKLCTFFLFLLAPGAFAATTVCEFNNPSTGTTPGCEERVIAFLPNNGTIREVRKDDEHVVAVHKTYPYGSNYCQMGLSSGHEDYSVTVFNPYGSCTWYRIDEK